MLLKIAHLKKLHRLECLSKKWGEPKNDQSNDLIATPDEPVISLHALARISSPQSLKIWGFIKHWPIVVLIDNGSTHNFVHKKVAEVVQFLVPVVSSFQVLIADGGTMKYEGRSENTKLQMGDYKLKTYMCSIEMGGCYIFLSVEWLCTLCPITMDFQELYMRFKKNNHIHTLRGLQDNFLNSSRPLWIPSNSIWSL